MAETPAPSPTPASTATPTPLPVRELAPDGPWLVFQATPAVGDNSGLWAINPDGTGLTNLVDEDIVAFAVQPTGSVRDGALIAYVTVTGNADPPVMELKMLHLPDRQVRTVAALINPAVGPPRNLSYLIYNAMAWGPLAWSPDGRQLAFIGQMDTPWIRVYVYDLETQSIHRLTTGATHAVDLSWSPDQRWVIHQGFKFLGMGGPEINGMWASNVDGRAVSTLYDPANGSDLPIDEMIVYGWLDDTHIVFANHRYEGATTVKSIDVSTRDARIILRSPFFSAAASPALDTWLFTSQDASAPRLWRDGAFTDVTGSGLGRGVWWSEPYGSFIGVDVNGRFYAISLSGQITRLPFPETLAYGRPDIIPSPDSALWAWSFYTDRSHGSELWIGSARAEPVQIDTGIEDKTLTWSPDSQRLFILSSHGLWAAGRPDFKPVSLAANPNGEPWHTRAPVWIP